MPLTARPNIPFDLVPLSRLLTDAADLALVNPNAKFPFDPLEWQEKWLGEMDDASFYLTDDAGADVGFFALRVGVGPEVRHLTYVFVAEEARGGAGEVLANEVEAAARALQALTITLKCETENDPAMRAYASAGYEILSERNGMATMRLELD
ncbi:GNAT family N-acetyltransferase [Puniceibacterium sediminis]|uniref:Ribosomal protein S18 acetylase RimI n=1 Tax=Puniceibacterium sediminis TaxID=1608407 RepID=A0A238W1D3_9RHOB|nr:GNAT family N-acetyltransferase [Puniceibacterium sediminis]SNR40370.1 Ribosomal protein S18 acetylase RimI [Puniceibacterium sediminis]